VIVGMGVIASLLLFMKGHWRSITPACTPPDVSGNVIPFIKVKLEPKRD